ncbi:MAG: hypothetical protein GY946_33375 [bacterium]|nr:hypothetical protein [bacterium]
MAEIVEVVGMVGRVEGKIIERFECYEGTSTMNKLAKDLDVHGVNLFARRPG